MTVTLHLKPELEAGLAAKAQSCGMDVDHYVQTLVEEQMQVPVGGSKGQKTRFEAVQRMLRFGEKYHLQFGEPITRQSMHEGHRH